MPRHNLSGNLGYRIATIHKGVNIIYMFTCGCSRDVIFNDIVNSDFWFAIVLLDFLQFIETQLVQCLP